MTQAQAKTILLKAIRKVVENGKTIIETMARVEAARLREVRKVIEQANKEEVGSLIRDHALAIKLTAKAILMAAEGIEESGNVFIWAHIADAGAILTRVSRGLTEIAKGMAHRITHDN